MLLCRIISLMVVSPRCLEDRGLKTGRELHLLGYAVTCTEQNGYHKVTHQIRNEVSLFVTVQSFDWALIQS
jgi:hypothetical protein